MSATETQRNAIFVLSFAVLLYHQVYSYHDPTKENVLYHCWWENASKSNPEPITCQGISIEWVTEPPSEVRLNQPFNVSYRIQHEDVFFQKRFGFTDPNYQNITDVRNFCHTSTCPESYQADSSIFRLECCVWHANIHVCHPGSCGQPEQMCGPWVDDDHIQSTHTEAIYGNINDTFSAEVYISIPKTNYMIAHVSLGGIQLAIQKIIYVTEYFCGDDKCTDDETCSSCDVDCCTGFPSFAIALIVLFVVALVVIVVLVISFILGWSYYQKRKLFYDESWIIDSSQIKQIDRGGHGGLFGSTFSLKNDSNTSINMIGITRKQMFIQTGNYQGNIVAIKKIERKKEFLQVTQSIRKEVMQIRMLDHQNLCKFIGAVVRDIGNLAIITEYCPKGSLNDVLQNEDIPLNWGFRFSFATDIARGMNYLHSKKVYHSRLRSSNCVIDDRWVVKITDYGIPSLRMRNPDLIDDGEEGNMSDMCVIYIAPEDRDQRHPLPTPTSNIYGYGTILLEIGTRIDPYSDELFVDSNGNVKIPDLMQDDCPCPVRYQELVRKCWDVNPMVRPNFDHIKKSIHRMNPNHESPVDMMMIMMEKYSKHLETLVNERTQELIAEQKKTQQLLYSMLPKPVADELRQGRPTSAQQFQSVTIYFSDIVGFTNLAGESTPMEVVGLLNELYSTFDDILDKFDVYKVETIGDAYMVVSGVPRLNGNRHAGEIARMSLKLLEATDSFVIPHKPTTKLHIRIGLHTGPVCAGVVGIKMPRYCLFGDTVNTASRMESNSEGNY
jgi:atrial natriuretic peptide receptor A